MAKTWIDQQSTVDAKSLNDIEQSIINLQNTKLGMPSGGSDGNALVKSGSTVIWSSNIADISSLDNKYYKISNINTFLNGSTSSSAIINLDSQFQTTSNYIVPAINEVFNLINTHATKTDVHGIDTLRTTFQSDILSTNNRIDAIDLQMADVDQALSDIDDEITLIKSRLDSISTGTGTGTSNSIGLEDFKSKNFSLIQTAAIQNKSGDNSVTFGEANDSSNSNFSITAGKNVTTSTGHDFMSIFGENLISDSDHELLIGKFNAPIIDGKFVIGDGDSTTRSNLLSLDINGNLIIKDKLNLNDGNLTVEKSLTTKNATFDDAIINNKLTSQDLSSINLVTDTLTVTQDITGKNLTLIEDLTARNLTIKNINCDDITSKNIGNSNKISTKLLETESLLVTNGTNTLTLTPTDLIVDNLIVNKDTKLNGNVTIVIDTDNPDNKFSVTGPTELAGVKTGDLIADKIVVDNSVSIASDLKVFGRILDSNGNAGEVGQVLTSAGADNFKWAAPEFRMPDVATNIQDYGRLYGLIQKSDTGKPNTSGYYSVVFGQNNNRENANYSITVGLDNASNTVHNFTQLFGEGLISDNNSELITGSFNKPVSKASFVIGNGTDDTSRSNLFSLDKLGNTQIFDTAGTSIFNLERTGNLTIPNKFTADSIEVNNIKIANGIDLTGLSLTFEDLTIENLTVNKNSTFKGPLDLRDKLTSLSDIEAENITANTKLISNSLETGNITSNGVLKIAGITNTGILENIGSVQITGGITTSENANINGNIITNNIIAKDVTFDNIVSDSIKINKLYDSTGVLDDKIGYILTVNNDGKTVSWKKNAAENAGIKNILDYGNFYGLIQKSDTANTAGKSSVVFGNANNRGSSNFSITSGSENSSSSGQNYTNVFGQGLVTDLSYETVIGKFNKAVMNGIFVVGNGSDVDNRSNVLSLDNTGNLLVNNGTTNIFNLTKDGNLTIPTKFTSGSIETSNLKVTTGIDLTGLSFDAEDLMVNNLTVKQKSILTGEVESRNNITSTGTISSKNLNVELDINSGTVTTGDISVTGSTILSGISNTGDISNTGTITSEGNISTTKDVVASKVSSTDIVATNINADNIKLNALYDSTGILDDKVGFILTVNDDGKTIGWKRNSAVGMGIKNFLDYGTENGLTQRSDTVNTAGKDSVTFGSGNNRASSLYSITAGTGNSSSTGHNYTNLFGEKLITDNAYETIIGKFNKTVTDGAFIIGNGTNTTNRSNLLSIDNSGNLLINNGSTNIFNLDSTGNLTIPEKLTANSIEVVDLKVTNGIDLTGLALTLEDLTINTLTVKQKSTFIGEIESKNNISTTGKITGKSIELELDLKSGSINTGDLEVTGSSTLNGISNTGNINTTGEVTASGNISTIKNIYADEITGNTLNVNDIDTDTIKLNSLYDSTGILDDKVGYLLTVNDDGKTVSWKKNAAIGIGIKNVLDYGSDNALTQRADIANAAGKDSVTFGSGNSRGSASNSITAGAGNSSSSGHNFTNLFGERLTSDNAYETVIGKYNKYVQNGVFVIGNGDSTARNNVFSLDNSGNLLVNNGTTNILNLTSTGNLTIPTKFTSDSIEVNSIKVTTGIDLTGLSLNAEDLTVNNLTVNQKSILTGEVESKSDITSTGLIKAQSLEAELGVKASSMSTSALTVTGNITSNGISNTGNITNTGTISSTGDITTNANMSASQISANSITTTSIESDNIILNALYDSTGVINDKIGYVLTVNSDGKTISWKKNAAIGSGIQNLLDYGTDNALIQKSDQANAAGRNSVTFGNNNSRGASANSITSGSGNTSSSGHDYTNLFGQGLNSDKAYETIIGKYNKAVSNGIFVIGNGNDADTRSNVFSLDNVGNLLVNNGATNLFNLTKDGNLTISNQISTKTIKVDDITVANGIDLTGLSINLDNITTNNLTVNQKSTLVGAVEVMGKITSNSSIEASSLTTSLGVTCGTLSTGSMTATGNLEVNGINNTGDIISTGMFTTGGDIKTTKNISGAKVTATDFSGTNVTTDNIKISALFDSTGTINDKIGYVLTINDDGLTVGWKKSVIPTLDLTNLLDYGNDFGLIQKATNANTAGKSSVVFGDNNSRSSANYSITSGSGNASSSGHDYTNLFGQGLFTDGPHETVIGKYNQAVANGAFVIGNGTSTNKSNLLAIDYNGNFNVNNKMKLSDGDLTVENSITSTSGKFTNLEVSNGINYTGAEFNIKNIKVEDLIVTKSFDIQCAEATFAENVTIGQKLTTTNLDANGAVNTGTLKTSGTISASGNISSEKNIIATGNISGVDGIFTGHLSANGSIEGTDIKGSSLNIVGNATVDGITCTSLAVQSITDSKNSSGSPGDVLAISQDGSKIVWTSGESAGGSVKNIVDYGNVANFSLIQRSTNTNSSGISSAVFGDANTRDKADYSITSGKDNYTASQHNYTAIFGKQLVSDDAYEIITGKYNKAVTDGALVIGNGNSDLSRSNVLELDKHGQLKINNGSSNLLTLDASGNLTIANRMSGGIATFETLTVTNGMEFQGDAITFRDLELDTLIVKTSADFECASVNIEKDIAVTGTLTAAVGNLTNSTINILKATSCDLTTINSTNITNSELIKTKDLEVSNAATFSKNCTIVGDLSCANLSSNTGTFSGSLTTPLMQSDKIKDHYGSVGGPGYFLSSDGQYLKWTAIETGGGESGGGSGTDYSADIANLYAYIGDMTTLKSKIAVDLVGAVNEVYDKAFSPVADTDGGVGKYYPDNDNPTADSGVIFNDYANNTAGGKYSASFGYQTKAMSDYQFTCGKQNSFDASALFVVGNGSGETYSNAMAVTNVGDIKISGIIKSMTGTCADGNILTAVDDGTGKLGLKWADTNDLIGSLGIDTLTSDVDNLKTRVGTLETNVSTNTANIATNTADIATNKTNIATNTADIATNKTNIAANATDIATNKTNIAANKTDISDLKTLMGTLSSLPTTAKDTIVAAITELYNKITTLETEVEALKNPGGGGGTPTGPTGPTGATGTTS